MARPWLDLYYTRNTGHGLYYTLDYYTCITPQSVATKRLIWFVSYEGDRARTMRTLNVRLDDKGFEDLEGLRAKLSGETGRVLSWAGFFDEVIRRLK